jgi:hypothetical protein
MYIVNFLKEHGKEVHNEVRAAYIDTMNKVNAKIRTFHQDFYWSKGYPKY